MPPNSQTSAVDAVLAHFFFEQFFYLGQEGLALFALGFDGGGVRGGRLVRLTAGIYLRPEAMDEAVSRLAAIEQPFTLSQARIALGTTRRIAVPLMELLDRTRRTARVDSELRTVRP